MLLEALSTAAMLAPLAQLPMNIISSERNWKMQKKQYNYQKWVQQQAWNREDNAVQRRVNDLRAAGLSPVLAAGSAASGGPVVSTQAPQYQSPDMSGLSDSAIQAMQMIKMKEDIANTVADRARIRMETMLANAKKNGQMIDNNRNARDNEIEIKSGMHSNTSAPGKIFRDAVNSTIEALQKVDINKVKPSKSGVKNEKGGVGAW